MIEIKEVFIVDGKKPCTSCGRILPISQFCKCKKMKCGYNSVCKECSNKKGVKNERNPNRRFRRWATNTLWTHRNREKFIINISADELEEMAEKATHCAYCGRELNWYRGYKGKSPKSDNPTLDRIDNGNILSKENIAIVCMRCNTTKGYHTMIEFVEYCKSVVNYNKDKIC